MSRKLVLFDIDGTLLASGGAGRRAILAAMHDLLPAGRGYDAVRFDGKTDPQIVTELLEVGGDPLPGDPERVARVLERYVTFLAPELERLAGAARLMPGIRELLDLLGAETGVVVGLVTGNVEAGAHLKLRAAGLEPDRFPVGAFGSDSAHRPDLPPLAARRAAPRFGREPRGHDVVIIGDTPADVTCGAGIGARAIAVATGSYTVDELESHRPYRTFADLADTESALEAILS